MGNGVIGSTHKRHDKKENQDSIEWSPTPHTIGFDQPIILDTDGHGSSRHFRSKKE